MILKAAVSGGHYAAAAAYLFFLAVVFAGMGRIFLEMTLGEASALKGAEKPFEASRQMLIPAACFFACAIFLGLYMPGWLNDIMTGAVNLIGGAI